MGLRSDELRYPLLLHSRGLPRILWTLDQGYGLQGFLQLLAILAPKWDREWLYSWLRPARTFLLLLHPRFESVVLAHTVWSLSLPVLESS